MSHNINHEAVYPPAVHGLRRMTHPSTRQNRKGSYELYGPLQKSLESPERLGVNSLAGIAPGSPDSVQDYNQVVERLQQDLEQSRRKEAELQQMLVELKNPVSHMNTMFLDRSYLDESPSNENIGENVKDAHIRHLQRQVTVLQASLYKSEGWSNRVATAVKERDKALDDVARLTSRIREMQDINGQLLHKIESLNTTLQAAHANLQQATEQLQNHHYSGQLVSQLKDEIHRQGHEIKTLKENHNRVDQENRGMKESSVETNSHSLNNLTCSQELEHLHKVVDKLKSTVLQQRTYLLQLRQPSNGSNTKSLNSSTLSVITDSLLDQESVPRRNSSSPRLTVSGMGSVAGEPGPGTLPHHAMYVDQSHAAPVKSRTPKENMEIQQAHRRASSDYVQGSTAGGGRTFKSNEAFNEVYNMDVLGSATQGGALVPVDTRQMPQLANKIAYIYTTSNQNPSVHFGQSLKEDIPKQNYGNGVKATNGYDPAKSPQHKKIFHQSKGNQIELVDHRINDQNKLGHKLDARGRQIRQWNLASANNSAALPSDEASAFIAHNGSSMNQGQRYKSPIHPQQETRNYEANTVPLEELEQFILDGTALQMRQTQFGNLHNNPATPTSEQIYHPPSNYLNDSVFVINNDMMGGGKMTITASPSCQSSASQTTGGRQEVVYVNSSGDQGTQTAPTASASADQNPSRTRLDSDRFCPVCSNNYSHVTMEEFQTHIFECFDNENPPETMKPSEAPDRTCPMCNARFSPTVAQAEYEKHVHSHFGDEAPGTNFVILQP